MKVLKDKKDNPLLGAGQVAPFGPLGAMAGSARPSPDSAPEKRTRVWGESGFTLLEVMIALAIIGTVLVALLGLGNRTIATGDRVQKLTQATMLAQAKMTEVEQIASASAVAVLQDEEGVFEEPFSNFSWRSRFTQTPLPQVHQVVVTVLWGDESRNESVDLTSFVMR